MPQCSQCGYDSNDDGAQLPNYKFNDGQQLTYCPECWERIDEREQFDGGLTERLA